MCFCLKGGMRKIPWNCLPIFFAVAVWLLCPGTTSVAAASTFGSERVAFGDYATTNWRSDDFEGSIYREWKEDGTEFTFIWETRQGNQIGSIGVEYGSSLLQTEAWEGVRLKDLPEDCVMSARAAFTPKTSAWFFWSIYGWTHPTYTYWGSEDAPDGFAYEFYIVFYTQQTREAFLAQPGSEPRGTVTIDGVVFDCYFVRREHFSQWFAVRRADTWNPRPSINLRAIFDYWRTQGLEDDQYVLSLAWALEGFSGSAGKLELTEIVIPELTPEP